MFGRFYALPGKLCLQNQHLAKQCIAALARELETSEDAAIRNNVTVVMCDLCVRWEAKIIASLSQYSCAVLVFLACSLMRVDFANSSIFMRNIRRNVPTPGNGILGLEKYYSPKPVTDENPPKSRFVSQTLLVLFCQIVWSRLQRQVALGQALLVLLLLLHLSLSPCTIVCSLDYLGAQDRPI